MAIIKRQNPHPVYASYKKYKPHLRVDFSYSCAYCTIHEAEHHWAGEEFRDGSKLEPCGQNQDQCREQREPRGNNHCLSGVGTRNGAYGGSDEYGYRCVWTGNNVS